jgi:hypothetical protein
MSEQPTVRPEFMARATEGRIPLDLYDDLHSLMFTAERPTPPYLGGNRIEGYRRADIEDSFGRFFDRMQAIAPELDPELLVRFVANMAFVERSGFEDGVATGVTSEQQATAHERNRAISYQMASQEATA